MTDAHVTLVIDRSGSMQSTKADAQGGLDSFVSELGATDDVTISLVEFDTEIDMAVPPVLASAWPGYTIVPRGGTALLDAIGFAIKKTKKHLRANPAEKVVLVVITDGGENASKKFTKEAVTELIDGAKADGWEVVFLASDLSASRTAASVGVASHTNRSFASADSAVVYADLAHSTTRYFSRESAPGSFSFEDSEVLKEVE